ncbi:MAG: hypothetical protein ACTTGZ_09645 [Treponema sp.]
MKNNACPPAFGVFAASDKIAKTNVVLSCTRTVFRAGANLIKMCGTNSRRLRALVPAVLFGKKVIGQGYSHGTQFLQRLPKK